MNLSKPLTSLIPSLEGEILTVLAGVEAPFTGRQIYNMIGKHSQNGVNKVLQKLSLQGIVLIQSAATSNLYQLNKDHLLAKHIIAASRVRGEFYGLLEAEVGSWEVIPECVAVFGSAVRTDMTLESDVDIFISRARSTGFGDKQWRLQMHEFALKVEKWTGNSTNVFEVGPDEIERELLSTGGVLYSIMDQGVVVYGPKDYLRKLRYRERSK